MLAAELGAELLFWVIVERAEKGAATVTGNHPLSKCNSNAQLCEVLIHHLTDREYRRDRNGVLLLPRTVKKRKAKSLDAKR